MDTATFAHPNATPRTLAVSAALVEAGAPLSDISRRLYRSKPDAQLRLFGRRPGPARDGGRRHGSSTRRCSTPTWPRPARSRPTPRGSSTCSPRPTRPRSRSCSRRLATGTRLSVRTKPGGVDATVLTGAFGGGGHARAAGATIARARSPRPAARSSPRRSGSSRRSPPLTRAPSPVDGDPRREQAARPDVARRRGARPAARRPRSASATAGRSTRSRPACCRCSSAGRRRVVEYHLGDRKALPGDGLLRRVLDDRRPRRRADAGRRRRRRRARPSRRHCPAFRGEIAQGPPAYSAVKVAGRRAYAMARAGEAVELADREGHDRGARAARVGRHRPDAADRDVDVRCSAGTYIRALARDLGAAVGSARTSARSSGPRAGRSRSTRRSRSTTSGRRPRTARSVWRRCCCPSTRAWTRSRRSSPPTTTSPRSRGASSSARRRPARRRPDPGPRRRRNARRDRPVRDGRLAPDKVLDRRAGPAGAPPVPDRGPVTVGGVDGLRTGDGPMFVVVGVFDGLHLGHATCSAPRARRRERRRARAR